MEGFISFSVIWLLVLFLRVIQPEPEEASWMRSETSPKEKPRQSSCKLKKHLGDNQEPACSCRGTGGRIRPELFRSKTNFSAFASLSLDGPDVPVIHSNDVCNEEGQNVILNCQAASYPGSQYTWYRDGVFVDSGPKLIIQNFSESQAGIYVCEALNQPLHTQNKSGDQHIHLEKSCVHNVAITGPPEGIETVLISLNCTAEGDNITYSWFKGSQPVHNSTRVYLINNNQTLVFYPCDRSDAAQYTCKASNNFSSDFSALHHLDIIYGPDTPFINETVDINLNQITLSCVVVAFPEPQILWLYNGLPVEENPQVIVLGITPEKSGNYTCRAANPRSRLQSETTLEIDMIGRLRSLNRR